MNIQEPNPADFSSTRQRPFNRREFLASASMLAAGAALTGCATGDSAARSEHIIDIHQHAGYSGRPNDALIVHQRAMGISRTILLPAGRPVKMASTHNGVANGLQAQALGNEECYRLAQKYPKEFLFAANEVPDVDGAVAEIEKYLKLGAVAIAEQKFGVECDSPEMQRLYQVAQSYDVPILMHWQFGMYNHGFDRFHKMLEKYPRVRFVGHAQTWWANIDKSHTDQKVLYPKTKVTPGGLTDRYLADYPNMYADMSAGSGLNALTRDEDHARGFIERHQDKLIYGSDCNDRDGSGANCQGAKTIAAIRRLAGSKDVERKLLYKNARRVFKI